MMTDQEVVERVRDLMAESRVLEAGFVLSMLCHKPTETDAGAADLAREAFFAGAHFVLDSIVRPVITGDLDEVTVSRLLGMMLKEIARCGADLCGRHPDGSVH